MKTVELLSFDLGASNGRAAAGSFDGDRLEISELYRFENNPVQCGRHSQLGRFEDIPASEERLCRI